MRPRHFIGRQILEVEVETEAGAFGLVEGVSDINARRFGPAIESVLDRLDRPGHTLRIDRLDLDLGLISLNHPEEATARLTRVLSDALLRALDEGRLGVVQTDRARIEGLERYLLTGTPPSSGVGFAGGPISEITDLARLRPEDWTAMVRRNGRNDRFLRRLVEQAPARVLADLVHRLEPAHAALIVSHIEQTSEVHRAHSATTLTEAPLRRVLWRVTLAHLLRDRGSRFNRLSYVRALLRGLAGSEGLAYPALLQLLHGTVSLARRRGPLTASLPALLAEIAATDLPPVAKSSPRSDDLARITLWLTGEGDGGIEEAFARSAAGSPAALAQVMTRQSWSAPLIARLVAAVSNRTLEALIRVLLPREGALVVAYMASVAVLHERRAPTPAPVLVRRLWRVTLDFVLRDAGTQFNRRSFALALVQSLAADEEVPVDHLLDDFATALPAAADPGGLADILSLLRRPRSVAATAPPATDPVRGAHDLIGRYDALDRFRAWMARDPAGPPVLSTAEADAVLTAVATLEAGTVLGALRGVRLDRRRIVEAFSEASPEEVARLLDRLSQGADLAAGEPAASMESAAGREADRLLAITASSRRAAAPRLARWSAVVRAGLDAPPSSGPVWNDAFRRLARRDGSTALALAARWADARPLASAPDLMTFETREQLLIGAPSPLGQAWATLNRLLGPAPVRKNPDLARHLFLGAALTSRTEATAAFRNLLSVLATTMRAGEAQRLGRELERRLPASLLAKVRDALPASPPPRGVGDPFEQLSRSLSDGRADLTRQERRRALSEWLADPRREQVAGLRPLLRKPDALGRLLAFATASDLARLLVLLAPADAARMAALARVLAEAAAAPGGDRPPWAVLIGAAAGAAPVDDQALIRRLLVRFGSQARARREGGQGRFVLFRAARLARDTGFSDIGRRLDAAAADLAAAFDGRPARVVATKSPDRPKVRTSQRPARVHPEAEVQPGECWSVSNAGLVLASGLLPVWMRSLDLLEEADGKASLCPETAGRAIHLLQHLVDHRTDAPETDLMLNKVLCGLPISTVVPLEVEPTKMEIQFNEMLLRSLIAQPPALAGTSLSGFRETFLHRPGLLSRGEDCWRLTVERKTVDVLIDSAFSISLIFNAWMPAPLHVTW